MQVERDSPCKVNFILNILGKRADGFHELETLLHPVRYCDRLTVKPIRSGVELTCSDPTLATDATNLVYRAAVAFRQLTKTAAGVSIHLEKRIPLAAGLGGGSSNAAATLLALNELFETSLGPDAFLETAATLGSDVPFFLQEKPALGFGRGERIVPLDTFPMLKGMHILLAHPGFGISTPWAYQALADFPSALNGTAGRAQNLAALLGHPSSDAPALRFEGARAHFYNSLEAPALYKFPLLKLYQECFLEEGAGISLMSGSGSSTFAIFASSAQAEHALDRFHTEFGTTAWTAIVPL